MGFDASMTWTPDIASTARSWPKCWRCSRRLGFKYPVESLGALPIEKMGGLHERYVLVFEVGCHDEKQIVRVRCPAWWNAAGSGGMVLRALADMWVFKRNGRGLYEAEPEHNQVVRIK